MNYIVNFINLLVAKLGGSIAPSSLSASTHLAATGTFFEGVDNLDDNSLFGSTTISAASAVTSAANEAYEQSNYEIHTSQAYVQALNEKELKYFIGELENYQVEEVKMDNPKILSRTINRK